MPRLSFQQGGVSEKWGFLVVTAVCQLQQRAEREREAFVNLQQNDSDRLEVQIAVIVVIAVEIIAA